MKAPCCDSEPVGEAQEEPNDNPFLKKPTAGRGFGDAFPKMSFNLDFSWNPFGKFLPFIMCVFCFLLVLTTFVYYKMLFG